MAFSGGAAQVVSDVLNYIKNVAETKVAQTTAAIQGSIAAAGEFPNITTPDKILLPPIDSIRSYRAPTTNVIGLNDLATIYGSETAAVAEQLSAQFDALFDRFFPSTEQYAAAADDWLRAAITDGGSGVNAFVEDQIWARDRARVLRESARASDEAMTAWTGRGFAMPPGALVHQLASIERDAQEKIGESSRERAVKTWEAELENVRQAVARSLAMRNEAITAAMEFTKMYALEGSGFGLQRTQNIQAANQRLTDNLFAFYKEDVENTKLNFQYKIDAKNDSFEVQRMTQKQAADKFTLLMQPLTQAIQTYGMQAAAALNGMHAQGSVSGSDNTVQNL